MKHNFSDYIIYADESGDHSLTKINPEFPMLCLSLCIIKKDVYINSVTPKLQQLKFDFFGHDRVILHERDIRKQEGDFRILINPKIEQEFIARLSDIISSIDFWVVSATINKLALRKKYSKPHNPYEIALKFCLEDVAYILAEQGQQAKLTHCIFESRGKKEDKQLATAFNLITKENLFDDMDLTMKFASKDHNSTGLQLADLLARPIALNALRPNQQNKAYDIINSKYYGKLESRTFP
jgi:hypothetical protein